MDTFTFKTGLHGKKAEQLVSLCWRMIRGEPLIERHDLFIETGKRLMQNDSFIIRSSSYDEIGWNVSLSLWRTYGGDLYKHDASGASLFGSQNCLNVQMDELGEVECIINRGRFDSGMSYDKLKKVVAENFYKALKESLPVISKVFGKLMMSVNRDFKVEPVCLEHVMSLMLLENYLDAEIGYVPILKKTVTVTERDLKILLDAIWRISQHFEVDQSKWKPHSGCPYGEEAYYEVIGREEVDPFMVSKNVIVQDKLKSNILTFISRSQDELKELEEKIENLKQASVSKVKSEFSKELDELSLLFV